MKNTILLFALLSAGSAFASECVLTYKQIDTEFGCVEKTSKRSLKKEVANAKECYESAIEHSKKVPGIVYLNITKIGSSCGPEGIYQTENYSFVEWKYGSLLNLEWPESGRVNSLSKTYSSGFSEGNQVFDLDGYLIEEQ